MTGLRGRLRDQDLLAHNQQRCPLRDRHIRFEYRSADQPENENATTQASGNAQGDAAHTTTYQYDELFRPFKSIAPPDPDPANGGAQAQITLTYSDLAAPNTFPWTLTLQKTVTTALSDSATSYFDGLGRGYQSQHVLPGGTATVDTTFDDVHSQLMVTNPYFSTADPTYGSTTTLSDGLGRATQITEQDGSIKKVDL